MRRDIHEAGGEEWVICGQCDGSGINLYLHAGLCDLCDGDGILYIEDLAVELTKDLFDPTVRSGMWVTVLSPLLCSPEWISSERKRLACR